MLTFLSALSHAFGRTLGRFFHAPRFSGMELIAVALFGAVAMWMALAVLQSEDFPPTTSTEESPNDKP